MKENDFIKGRFEGDDKDLVAIVTRVYDESFDCSFFTKNKSNYTFSNDGTVIISNGFYPKGTKLASYKIFTRSKHIEYKPGSFVGVTFRDGKTFLGQIQSPNPANPNAYLGATVRFLHSGSTYIFNYVNHEILESSGSYKAGESIKDLSSYEEVDNSPEEGKVKEEIENISEDNNNTHPPLDNETRQNFVNDTKDAILDASRQFSEAIGDVKDDIEKEIKEEEALVEFWLDLAFNIGSVLLFEFGPLVKMSEKILKPAIEETMQFVMDEASVVDIKELGKSVLEKVYNYPKIKDAIMGSSVPDDQFGFLRMIRNEFDKTSKEFRAKARTLNNSELLIVFHEFYDASTGNYAIKIKELADNYKDQIMRINPPALVATVPPTLVSRDVGIIERNQIKYMCIYEKTEILESESFVFKTWITKTFKKLAIQRSVTRKFPALDESTKVGELISFVSVKDLKIPPDCATFD